MALLHMGENVIWLHQRMGAGAKEDYGEQSPPQATLGTITRSCRLIWWMREGGLERCGSRSGHPSQDVAYRWVPNSSPSAGAWGVTHARHWEVDS